MSWCVVDNLYFWYCVESVVGCHEGTDALSEVTDLDADITQEGTACPSSHNHDFFWLHFGQIELHGKPWTNGVGAHLFVWEFQYLFAKGKCAWPQGFGCPMRGDCCYLKIYPDLVHWCVTCCSWLWVHLNHDFRPDAHQSEGFGRSPLCHCGVFNPAFLCLEFWGELIGQMEDPTVMWKFTAFSIKTYTPYLKDMCEFVLPFWSSWVLAGPHAEEKCACNQLADGCAQMCVCRIVDVEE